MQDNLKQKLSLLALRLEELSTLLSSQEALADMQLYTQLNREYADLQPIVDTYHAYTSCIDDIGVANEMLLIPDMKDFAYQEIDSLNKRLTEIEHELEILLLPNDPDDNKNVFVEIRAGTGGDESGLFSADLLRMYIRFAERNSWATEIMSESPSTLGGFKEVVVKISGKGVYAKLKFESGAHRVQRVPVTEAQGRIHTSACTVAVMPEADEIAEVDINPADLKIDTYRASGAGGQHINKTDSAIRITHLPTGIVVECQEDRSQHRNRAKAMSLLAAHIKNEQLKKQASEISSNRRNLVGSGDRSEKIRTYNFPQGRVTDHRIHLTLYKLDSIMDGDLYELIDALVIENQADLLASAISN